MKTLLRSLPVALAVWASSFASAANAATSDDDQVVVNATIQEYVALSLESSSVNMEAEIADLNAGFVDSDPFTITVRTNKLGQVSVSAQTLENGDNRANKITPTDLQLKVSDAGVGNIQAPYSAFTTIPRLYDETIWRQAQATPREVSFDVQFRHRNVNLYAGKSTPYTNSVRFVATTN